MAHQPIRATKKPVTIDAMQWDGTPEGATPVIDWVDEHGGNATYACIGDECTGTAKGHHIAVTTLEGSMYAGEDWWIIKGIEGEFYPCKDSVFRNSYDVL